MHATQICILCEVYILYAAEIIYILWIRIWIREKECFNIHLGTQHAPVVPFSLKLKFQKVKHLKNEYSHNDSCCNCTVVM